MFRLSFIYPSSFHHSFFLFRSNFLTPLNACHFSNLKRPAKNDLDDDDDIILSRNDVISAKSASTGGEVNTIPTNDIVVGRTVAPPPPMPPIPQPNSLRQP
ncbi:unnamed protein product [Protopolystoma xenopodis]|uniref:Uncharacterized protein n=1 Tax=Protopolystoma xenopodis TaxID=117903 RepID=A0A448WVG4_9PLAT|nr:unnamed protein product [Protopolystoma xenopodis]